MKLLSHPIILSVFLLCFCAGAFFIGHAALSYATFQSAENFCVLLDAGHGGNDPGKVSSSGVKEKDINLAITLKCQSVLEQNGVKVILTRNSDCSLADSNASNKKASDLKKRKALIKESQINCAVSIHQNSFLILPHMELRYSIIRKTLTASVWLLLFRHRCKTLPASTTIAKLKQTLTITSFVIIILQLLSQKSAFFPIHQKQL